MNLIAELDRLKPELEERVATVASLSELEELQIDFLGRKGRLSQLMSRLPELPGEERPAFGKAANAAKDALTSLIEGRKTFLAAEQNASELARFDPTVPGRLPHGGSLHPITQVMEEICGVLERLGFEAITGPEVETDFYNFEALNFGMDHPARDMQDTFFVPGGALLRTHTSPVQVRTLLERQRPPIAIIAPGKVYRRDSDITHTPMFHQIEGMLVDTHVSMTHLRGTLTAFVRELFGPHTEVRFRPSFFPFTEPSIEVDISCILCEGKGHSNNEPCRVCKTTGWLEVLGAGMIDPAVFTSAGYDPKTCSGFAFGLGIERIAMLKFGITDLRLFFENDLRFLSQFA